MSDRDNVIQFTRGVMDRIRDHCKEKFPEEWEHFDTIPVHEMLRIPIKRPRLRREQNENEPTPEKP